MVGVFWHCFLGHAAVCLKWYPSICAVESDRVICEALVCSLTNAQTLKLEITFKRLLL